MHQHSGRESVGDRVGHIERGGNVDRRILVVCGLIDFAVGTQDPQYVVAGPKAVPCTLGADR